tara:strand:- start:34 stop:273 length:240 start_codon:yes stop_codon:yes gene_type:complete
MASRKNYRTSNRPHFTQSDESSSVKLSSKVRLPERRSKRNDPVTVVAYAIGNVAKLNAADAATERAKRLMAETFDRPVF